MRDQRREGNTLRNFRERRQQYLELAAKADDGEVADSLLSMAASLQIEIVRLEARASGKIPTRRQRKPDGPLGQRMPPSDRRADRSD